MPDLAPRLNNVIAKLEQGHCVFGAFAPSDPSSAVTFAHSDFDLVIFEMEHLPWDAPALRVALQFLLDRRQIAEAGSLAPKVTPFLRVPANGAEMSQWFAKQALDLGCYGIVWPRVTTVEQARNAVAACRYPRLPEEPLYEPAGLRGDGPGPATRYWGVSQAEYYKKADVWPLNPEGELLVVIMIENQEGIQNLPDMLEQVPGIGMVLIGEGDMSQELGIPRQYDNPRLIAAMDEVARICTAHGVPVGHPHVTEANAASVVTRGFQLMLAQPSTDFRDLQAARSHSGVR